MARPTHKFRSIRAFADRLGKDTSGNTIALVTAAVLPLLGMVGSGIDMGRAYVTEIRLQQACDAGTLAARKKLGSDLPPSNSVVGQIRKKGNEFFDLNFEKGRYDTTDRRFDMTLEPDFSISATASATLPTAVMGVFGFNEIPIAVTCGSRMNFTNLDVMMVLDTTGSMRQTNAGDSEARIDAMRRVIKSFSANLEATKNDDTRIRYGFVPYATNVNVANLLSRQWLVRDWEYQSRRDLGETESEKTVSYTEDWTYVSGSRSPWQQVDSYPATVTSTPPTRSDFGGSGGTSINCDGAEPARTVSTSDVKNSEDVTTTTSSGGTRTEEYIRRTTEGARYRTRRDGNQCIVEEQVDTNYVEDFVRVTEPKRTSIRNYRYEPISYDVSRYLDSNPGCIEERATYPIADFSDVDLTQAMDLDINLVPERGNSATQWRPHTPGVIYARKLDSNGNGSWHVEPVDSAQTYAKTGEWWMSSCPAEARRLAEMDAEEIDQYLGTLSPEGATYHDIGMIWGGRLLSQNGLFADDNKDVSTNKPTARHLIFLTDGETEPYDTAYGPYGLEPLDRRRWSPDSGMSLKDVVESRFAFACDQVKKNNTTVWVIAFGVAVNESMTKCAGPGRYFEATDAADLDRAFKNIATSMGDLRIMQ